MPAPVPPHSSLFRPLFRLQAALRIPLLTAPLLALLTAGCSVTWETEITSSDSDPSPSRSARAESRASREAPRGAVAILDAGALAGARVTFRGYWRETPSDQWLENKGMREEVSVKPVQKPGSSLRFTIDKSGLGPLAGFFIGGFNLMSGMAATGGTPYEILDEAVFVIDPEGGSLWLESPRSSSFSSFGGGSGLAWENMQDGFGGGADMVRENLIREEMTLEELASAWRHAGKQAEVQRRKFVIHPQGEDRITARLPLETLLAEALSPHARPGHQVEGHFDGRLITLSGLQEGEMTINLSRILDAFRESDRVASLSIGTVFAPVTITASETGTRIQYPAW